jgi:hypothetical protein
MLKYKGYCIVYISNRPQQFLDANRFFSIQFNILLERAQQRRDPNYTKVVSSNPTYVKAQSIQHYMIKFVNDLRKVGGFLRFSPPIKLPDRHDITK